MDKYTYFMILFFGFVIIKQPDATNIIISRSLRPTDLSYCVKNVNIDMADAVFGNIKLHLKMNSAYIVIKLFPVNCRHSE